MATNDSRTFIMEDNVYKGEITSMPNYKSIGEMIWNKIKSHGNKIAHLDACTEIEVTYAELQNKIVRCALWLQERGIKSNDIISVCTNNHLNSIVPCLAAIYINAIFNPWNENMDLHNTLHVMQLTTPKVIFCSKKSVNVILSAIKKFNYNPTVVVFGDHPDIIKFSDILRTHSNAEVENFQYVDHDDMKKTMCIMHSSGTTGPPKGVELSNYSLLRFSDDKNVDLIDGVAIWSSTIYWITGVMMNFMAIVQGAKVIIYPEFDEEMLCLLIKKYKITMAFLSTSMINRLLISNNVKKFSLSSLKTIIFGGSRLKLKVHAEIRHMLSHVQVLQGFGMTELGGFGTLQKLNHKNGSCGTVVQNVQMKIVDRENGKAFGPNRLGELYIKTENKMKGYYKNLEATKNTVDEQGWLHSGDISYFDEDGELFIVDRIKELIKYRGYQISPGEIEDVLLSHPAVSEVAVTAIPHPIDDEHCVAFVVKKPGVEVTEQELIDLVTNNMMDQYKLRGGVIFVNALPHTNTGKISKKELKVLAAKLLLM